MTRTRRLKVDHNLQRSWRKQRRLLYNIDWLEVLSCAQAARLEPIEPPSDADDDASFLVYGELVERLTASRCLASFWRSTAALRIAAGVLTVRTLMSTTSATWR